ncbi:MAG TPA: hypothetical protein VHO01_14770 [Jatrophihabitans sp.]|nr:hypothetical protein [Jatrophihabitans sp.]
MSALSELLRSANTQGLSARAIAKLAREAGFTLNHDTAARYLRGDHGRPDEDTLIAFATVLPVKLAELRRAAELPAEDTSEYRPPPESARLSRRQRRAVDEIIRAMLESRSGSELDRRREHRRAAEAAPEAARRGDVEPPSPH